MNPITPAEIQADIEDYLQRLAYFELILTTTTDNERRMKIEGDIEHTRRLLGYAREGMSDEM